jgi:hypothetical protein
MFHERGTDTIPEAISAAMNHPSEGQSIKRTTRKRGRAVHKVMSWPT